MSEITREELESMQADELKSYGEQQHGIQFKARDTKPEVIDKIMAAENGGDPGKVDSGEMSGTAGPNEDSDDEDFSIAEEEAAGEKAERVRIKIHAGPGPDGNDDVKVSVNGKMFQIKRDTEVNVPQGVLSVLRDAVTTVTQLNGTYEDGSMKYTERQVPRFAVEVIGPARS